MGNVTCPSTLPHFWAESAVETTAVLAERDWFDVWTQRAASDGNVTENRYKAHGTRGCPAAPSAGSCGWASSSLTSHPVFDMAVQPAGLRL